MAKFLSKNNKRLIFLFLGVFVAGFSFFVPGLGIYFSRHIVGLHRQGYFQIINDLKSFLFFLGIAIVFFGFILSLERVWSKFKNIIINTTLVFCSIVVTLALIEIALYCTYKNISVGGALSPSFYTIYKDYKHNRNGYRDNKNYYYKKRHQGIHRTLVLGDSLSYGSGVKDVNKTYPKLLEGALNTYISKGKFEVLNFSRSGRSTEEELNLFKTIGKRYDPDTVILGYYLNDAETEEVSEEINTSKKTLELLPEPYEEFITGHSYTYYIFKYMLKALFLNEQNKYFIHSLYRTDRISKHIDTLEELILLVQEKSSMIIVIFPVITDFNNYPYKYIHKIIKEVATRNNVNVIDLLPSFKAEGYRTLRVSRFDSHPNEKAHLLAAKQIFWSLYKDRASFK
ncbi:MAG: SGNH/GDSL hydrolase family protein [Proteobacteria bacterium]|nr:SGNH/GDSL hydrolase family protein [Pseudomonadota bacterium]